MTQLATPAEPTVTCTAFQSCGGKAEEAKLFIAAGGDRPDRVTGFRQRLKVMMSLYQCLETGFFRRMYWTSDYL